MPDLAESLQSKTHNLRIELEWIKAARGEEIQTALEHLRQLRSELSACGNLLGDPQFASGGAMARRAASDYRDCLQRLQEALPILQSQLLTRRSLLQPEREHVGAAGQWLRCNTTLG